MKVLLVNGSSHAHGTTMRALEEMIRIFDENGVETEVIQLGGKPVADCLQCNVCQKTGKCVFKDDGVNDFVEKAYKADGFVFASPTYFAHPSGRLLSFLDRAFYSCCKDEVYQAFMFKPGAAVVTARRGGTATSYDVINKYFGIAQMPVVTSSYWNNVHGLTADDAVKDEEGLQVLRNLARNMIWMMKSIAAAKEAGIEHPETESEAVTNFIKRNDNLR
jgi:multimeric flavodoxin WrbA